MLLSLILRGGSFFCFFMQRLDLRLLPANRLLDTEEEQEKDGAMLVKVSRPTNTKVMTQLTDYEYQEIQR